MADLQQKILQGYLKQQLHEVQQPSTSTALQTVSIPTNEELEAFKAHVRTWIEVDNTLKKLQQATRERRTIKQQLTEKITAFMARFNIEDLSTRDGKIRFKTRQVKAPLSKKTIQQRLLEMYPRAKTAEELTTVVFDTSERVERATLRRVTVRPSHVQ